MNENNISDNEFIILLNKYQTNNDPDKSTSEFNNEKTKVVEECSVYIFNMLKVLNLARATKDTADVYISQKDFDLPKNLILKLQDCIRAQSNLKRIVKEKLVTPLIEEIKRQNIELLQEEFKSLQKDGKSLELIQKNIELLNDDNLDDRNKKLAIISQIYSFKNNGVIAWQYFQALINMNDDYNTNEERRNLKRARADENEVSAFNILRSLVPQSKRKKF